MKKIAKILMIVSILSFTSISLFAGGAKDTEKEPAFQLSEQEKKQGWRYFMPIGFKLHRPEYFDTYKDNADSTIIGNEKDDEVIYQAYSYGFVTNSLLQEYYETIRNKKLSREQKIKKVDEINSKILPVYSLMVLNTALINKDLKEITGYPINEVIRKTDKYTQVLAIAKFSKHKLNESDARIYYDMISQVMPIKDSITCVDPIAPREFLMAVKFKFKTVDINGNKVTDKILKDYDVTMLNIWATWCPPCKAELPEIAKLYENFKDKKCNVIGLTWNLKEGDEKALADAKALTEKSDCKYTILQNNEKIKHLFSTGLTALPTTIFFDRNGNVIASEKEDIILGSRDLEEFSKAMEKALQSVSNK